MNSRISLWAALMVIAGAAQAQSPVVLEWTSPRLEGSAGHPNGSCSCSPIEKNAMATDAAGNAYVAGYRNVGPATVWTVSKIDPSGAVVWQVSNPGPERRFDYAYAVAVDPNGNPVVTGSSYVPSGTSYLTIKFSAADGSQLWERRYSGVEGGSVATAIAIDAAGDVVVAGSSQKRREIGTAYATVKYRGSDGEQLWASRYSRVTNEGDRVGSLALDRGGNVFVTGASGSSQFSKFATVKYDGATGAQQWVALYGPQTWTPQAHAALGIAVDSHGDPVVVGQSFGLFEDFATIKYDGATGDPRWVARFDGAVRADLAKAVAIDGNDDVYVTGASVGGPGSTWNMATLKYAGASGSELWRAIGESPWARNESAYAILVDASGVQVAGWATDTDGKYHPYAIGYSAATGAQLWSSTFDQPPATDTATIALKPAGNGAYYLGVENYYARDAHFLKRFRLTP
ncbi:outer membrane protein assembly factor BamB family protein [Lysobacter sp. TAB13]|uniref:outer membrane protein assembly factor BamB family protein n=1 Tax=Lysobacter sp. TAB13 TaxID=3233065 RepID=UPI003F9D1BA6